MLNRQAPTYLSNFSKCLPVQHLNICAGFTETVFSLLGNIQQTASAPVAVEVL